MNRILLILGGTPPSAELFHRIYKTADLSIAADCGIEVFLQNNVMPHFLTGDFDSIKRMPPPNASVKIIPAPEQSATDFEKALALIKHDDWKELVILGGTGGRYDHFLTSLLIASEIKSEKKVSFLDDSQEIYRITPDCDFSKKQKESVVISLIPFPRAIGVTTQGLRWDLISAEMHPSILLGQSNFNIKENISASIEAGMLYLIINTHMTKTDI